MTEDLDDQLVRLENIDVPAPQPVAELRRRAVRRRRRIGTRAVAAVALVGLAIGLVASNEDAPSQVDSVDDRVDTEPSPAWHPLAPSPIAGRFAAATATDGRRMFVWGGIDGSRQQYFADGAIYDPATDAWATVPNAPAPMQGPSGRAVWDGARFLVLEADADTPLALAAYDPSARQWERLADPPLEQREGFNATWTGTELIVSGGGAGDTIADTFAAAYDPSTDEWRVLPQPPFPHYTGGAAIWVQPVFVVAGGASGATGASAEPGTAVPGAMYTSGSPGGWTVLPTGPVAAQRWATPVEDGIVVVGDEDGFGTRLGVGVFRPSALAWTELPSIEPPSPAIDVVADGRGGFVVLTQTGGLRVRDQPATETLPPVDLSARAVPAVVVAGDTLIVWGGLNETQTGALGDGFSLLLEASGGALDRGSSATSTAEEQRRAEAAAAADAARAAADAARTCAAAPDTGVTVDRYVLTTIPDRFVQAGLVRASSTGYVDMGGTSETTVQFVDPSGRTLAFTVVGDADSAAADAAAHAGAQTTPVELVHCTLEPADQRRPTVWNVSATPDRVAATGDGWEYGLTTVVGSGGVSVDELLLLLSGLRS